MDNNNTNSMEPVIEKKLNPWFSMWLQPRYTMRTILDRHDRNPIILLAALGGIASAFSKAAEKTTLDSLLGILSTSIIGGMISGIIGIYIIAWLVKWTGSWLGGQGTYEDIKTALAWANVPVIWSLIGWTLGIFIFGKDLFIDASLILDTSIFLNGFSWVLSMIFLLIDIWVIFTEIKCVAEAQQFSSWKAFGNLLLSILVLFVPIMLIALLFAFV